MRTTTGIPDFWGKNSISPESLLATKPLTKEPEDSGYEIATREEKERGPGNEVGSTSANTEPYAHYHAPETTDDNDVEAMCASPRWRPNREIVWHLKPAG